jgi:hypothetical protein
MTLRADIKILTWKIMKPCGPIAFFVEEVNSSLASAEYDLMFLAMSIHLLVSDAEPIDE